MEWQYCIHIIYIMLCMPDRSSASIRTFKHTISRTCNQVLTAVKVTIVLSAVQVIRRLPMRLTQAPRMVRAASAS